MGNHHDCELTGLKLNADRQRDFRARHTGPKKDRRGLVMCKMTHFTSWLCHKSSGQQLFVSQSFKKNNMCPSFQGSPLQQNTARSLDLGPTALPQPLFWMVLADPEAKVTEFSRTDKHCPCVRAAVWPCLSAACLSFSVPQSKIFFSLLYKWSITLDFPFEGGFFFFSEIITVLPCSLKLERKEGFEFLD